MPTQIHAESRVLPARMCIGPGERVLAWCAAQWMQLSAKSDDVDSGNI